MKLKLFLAASAAYLFMNQVHAMDLDSQQSLHPKIKLDTNDILSDANKKVALTIYRGAYQALETETREVNTSVANKQKEVVEESYGQLYDVSYHDEQMYWGYYHESCNYRPQGEGPRYTPEYTKRCLDIKRKLDHNHQVACIRDYKLNECIYKPIHLNNTYYPDLGNISYRDLEEVKKTAQNFYNIFEAVSNPRCIYDGVGTDKWTRVGTEAVPSDGEIRQIMTKFIKTLQKIQPTVMDRIIEKSDHEDFIKSSAYYLDRK